jgi:hypothetical protein
MSYLLTAFRNAGGLGGDPNGLGGANHPTGVAPASTPVAPVTGAGTFQYWTEKANADAAAQQAAAQQAAAAAQAQAQQQAANEAAALDPSTFYYWSPEGTALRNKLNPPAPPAEPPPATPAAPTKTPYVNPPPASQGGPTAYQIMNQNGMLDPNGYLINNPGVHGIVAAMYGGGPSSIADTHPSMNPDWEAGQNGKTVGQNGDAGPWGEPINWSQPQGSVMNEGDIFETPAGNYKVGKNAWGQFVLLAQDGAPSGASNSITNMTNGQHHIGINPATGETWYQEAAGGLTFSGGGKDYYVNPNGPGYEPPNNYANGNNNGGSNTGSNTGNSTSSPNVVRSTWQDVANNGVGYDPYLQMNTGSTPIQWDALIGQGGDLTRLNEEFEKLAASGVFGEWGANVTDETKQKAESAYALLLRNLGLE